MPAAKSAPRRNIIAAAIDLLLYPHAWVRSAAARVLGLALATVPAEAFLSGSGSRGDVAAVVASAAKPAAVSLPPWAQWMASPAALHAVARRCVSQLASPLLTSALADQASRNLLHLTLALHAATPASAREPLDTAVAAGHAADVAAGAVAATTTAAAASAAGASSSGTADQLMRLFSFACAVGRFHADTARGALLRWIAAASVRLPASDMRRYLRPVVQLLYRLSQLPEAPSAGGIGGGVAAAAAAPAASSGSRATSNANANLVGAEARGLGAETLELLQSSLGAQAVLQMLAAERAAVASTRLVRRRDRAQQRITDPVAAAREREKKQKAKRRQKARRVATLKHTRGREPVLPRSSFAAPHAAAPLASPSTTGASEAGGGGGSSDRLVPERRGGPAANSFMSGRKRKRAE